MNSNLIEEKFEKIGVRIKFRKANVFQNAPITFDLQKDKRGEYFVCAAQDVKLLDEIDILDVRPKDRHLLLLFRNTVEKRKDKFLFGHDERHFFVSAVPDTVPVKDVKSAKKALIPPDLQGMAISIEELKRKNKVWHRQGEFFFVKLGVLLKVDDKFVIKNEPLQRNIRSKPHMIEFCYREGGEERTFATRMVNMRSEDMAEELRNKINQGNKRGFTKNEFQELPANIRNNSKKWGWQLRKVNPEVYAKGRITHSDHRTVILDGWHRVYLNGEMLSPAARDVIFID